MDSTPLERDLLQHHDFLLRLAAGLVGTNDAEDLVQDVWTKALTHSGAAPGSARGWLTRVARNLAVNRFRLRGRRESREREHVPTEPSSGPVEEASERFELTQRVAAAVRTLEEPYRAVILLRFFEGLDHATMAARLGVPIATVRTRQQRALGQLRERLDREFGGRQAWGLALAAWSASQELAAPVAGGAVALVAASAVLVSLAGGAWWLVRGRGESSPGTGIVTATPEVSVPGAMPGAAPAPSGAGTEPSAEPAPRATERMAFAAAVPETPEAPASLAAPTPTVLRGRVLSQDRRPAANASLEVYGLEDGLPRETAVATTRCDVDGRYELRVEQVGALVAIALVEGLRPAHAALAARAGDTVEVPDLVLEDGQTLAGRVLRLGAPMPLASVGIRSAENGRELRRAQGLGIEWFDGRPEWTGAGIETDAQGRFELSGFAARDYLLEARGSPDMGKLPMDYERVRVRAPSTDLALEFQASLVTLVRAPGSPGEVEGWLHVRGPGDLANGLWLAAVPEGGPRNHTFVAPPATALELSIELAGLDPIPMNLVTPGPGEELRLTLAYGTPSPATLELEWTPPDEPENPDLTVETLRVEFVTPEGQLRLERRFQTRELEGGLVRVEGVPPGRYRVRIAPGSKADVFPLCPAELSLELWPGQTLRERFAFEPAGLVRLDVRAPSGERCAASFRLLDSARAEVRVNFFSRRDGNTLIQDKSLTPWSVHESGPLAAGDYELVLWGDGFAEQCVPVRVVVNETTDVAVTLQPK